MLGQFERVLAISERLGFPTPTFHPLCPGVTLDPASMSGLRWVEPKQFLAAARKCMKVGQHQYGFSEYVAWKSERWSDEQTGVSPVTGDVAGIGSEQEDGSFLWEIECIDGSFIPTHVLVLEMFAGHPLPDDAEVEYGDGDANNNDISNLVVYSETISNDLTTTINPAESVNEVDFDSRKLPPTLH